MRRFIFLVLVFVMSATSCSNTCEKFTPNNELFLEIVKKYDSDKNLCMYRFKDTETAPSVENAMSYYPFEYEVLSSSILSENIYQVDVIRRCPDDPSFAPPVYIRFLLNIESADSYSYISVMNYTDGGEFEIEDVIINAVKCYDISLTDCDFSGKANADFYLQYLTYAALNMLQDTYSTVEYKVFTDYDNELIYIPADIADNIIEKRFGDILVRDKIPQYDPTNNIYSLPLRIYENFYSLDIVDLKHIEDGVYRVKIKKDHRLSTDNSLISYITFILEISGDNYKYLSVKYN